MAQPAQTAVDVRQFQGMFSNADPHDLPPGMSVVQVNAAVIIVGQLQVRRGLRELKFDKE